MKTPLRSAALCIALWGCAFDDEPHPTDAVLLERFAQHRANLEQLVAMFLADSGLARVGRGFTRPDNPQQVGVPESRIAQYRELCRVVGAINCIEGYDASYDRLYTSTPTHPERKDPVWIHVSSRGLSITGSGKGYVYSWAPRFPLVPLLDTLQPVKSGTWLRHITGPWYLYYDYED